MIHRCKVRAATRKIQTKNIENFRGLLAEKGGILKITQLFLKIFAEKFWYYENTIYFCIVKIILFTNQKNYRYGTNHQD